MQKETKQRDINDTHVVLRYLPSRGVPYEEDITISLRPLKLGEVDYIFSHKDKIVDIITYIAERDVVRGIDVLDLTVDDWEFIELSLVSTTFPNAKYELYGGECPNCGNNVQVIDLKDLEGNVVRQIEVKPELKGIVVPTQISFHTLDEDVNWPIYADLSVGKTQFDFLRLRHYVELANEGIEQKDWTPLVVAEKMCGHKAEDLAFEDGEIINYIRNKLDHGVLKQFTVSCNVCSTEYPIQTAWEVADFIPFWEDRGPARNRVHFGNGG